MRTLAVLTATTLALSPLTVLSASASPPGPTAAASTQARAGDGRSVSYTSWDTGAELRAGKQARVRVARGKLRLDGPVRQRLVGGRSYDVGRWTSPWVTPGFGLTELIPSWEAATPEGTFVEIQVKGRTPAGRRSSWDTIGRWASGDGHMRRTSVPGQGDDLADVNVDTFEAVDEFASWRVRVTLHRLTGTTLTPRVDAIGAVASRIPSSTGVTTSRPRTAAGVVLPVPRYSQMIHEGHSPQYGGGGEAWCSPTSLAMVLGYYDALPVRAETSWVGRDHRDRVVDHLARSTYDYSYRGTGNWPFNTAQAATRTREAFVTRFTSLVDVERLIAAGIPVITSITFGRGQLANAPISASNGHLLVVVGFTESGDVVVNDPAAPRKPGVRRTYDRGQFEDAWLKRGPAGGSGGVGYVIRDAAHPLPPSRGTTSW